MVMDPSSHLISRHEQVSEELQNCHTEYQDELLGFRVTWFLCFSPSFAANVYIYYLFTLSGTESEIIYIYIIPWFSTLLFVSSLLNLVILALDQRQTR